MSKSDIPLRVQASRTFVPRSREKSTTAWTSRAAAAPPERKTSVSLANSARALLNAPNCSAFTVPATPRTVRVPSVRTERGRGKKLKEEINA